ncbi:methyltransferase [Petroclostridium sp. X23]|uniref:methyltransferase n=1 Tax=Petroclostridium sp. X23 TaxID=3045146 RepID=UPI0024AD78F1|nr:methyltransferase [Petroclostridium sp. X23]WHH58711.1 methyltransferase [Petroclostridium sp. X23]
MYQPQNNPKLYYKLLHQKREAELLLSALRLDVFSYLEDWTAPGEVAGKTGFDERGLAFYLNALACIGMLEKKGNAYRNTPQSNEFLNKNSPVYLGECILFREHMMSLKNLDAQVRKGPNKSIYKSNSGVAAYDFYEAARVSVPEMYTGRVQSLIAAVRQLFVHISPKKILDLGGGSGILGMELVRTYSGCAGVIFEHPSVADLPRRLVEEYGLSEQVSVLTGDFNKDDIGDTYDLIIASGILDFAKDNLDSLMEKLYDGLTPDGYLYIVTHNVSEDYQFPAESILGWLSGHLDGLDILLTKKTIDEGLEKQGFRRVQHDEVGGAFNSLQGEFYCKQKKEDM